MKQWKNTLARKQAKSRGRNDFHRNKRLGDGPYKDAMLNRDWMLGWISGIKDLRT